MQIIEIINDRGLSLKVKNYITVEYSSKGYDLVCLIDKIFYNNNKQSFILNVFTKILKDEMIYTTIDSNNETIKLLFGEKYELGKLCDI